jgi:hypothetical protein
MGRFFDTHAAEEPALYDTCETRIQTLEPVEKSVDGDQLVQRPLCLQHSVVQRDALKLTAALLGPCCHRMVDEHSPHGLGRNGQEVRAILPGHAIQANQLHVRFVNQARRVERVIRPLAAPLAARDGFELLIKGLGTTCRRRLGRRYRACSATL